MKQLLNYLLNKQWILSIVMYFLSDDKKEKIYIAKFRNELAFWGHDTSKMSDKDIKEGINAMGEMLTKCSFTTDEITEAFKVLANCTIKNNYKYEK